MALFERLMAYTTPSNEKIRRNEYDIFDFTEKEGIAKSVTTNQACVGIC